MVQSLLEAKGIIKADFLESLNFLVFAKDAIAENTVVETDVFRSYQNFLSEKIQS